MSDQTVDYRPMWEELGLDLASHDALLGAVGQCTGTRTSRRRTAPRAWATSTS